MEKAAMKNDLGKDSFTLSLSLSYSDFIFLFFKHIEVIIPYQEVRERGGVDK